MNKGKTFFPVSFGVIHALVDLVTLTVIFGSITFHGAIEIMEGDVPADEVAAEVRQKIDALAPGGGYVLASCNHMIDVKPENILALFETARVYGRYG